MDVPGGAKPLIVPGWSVRVPVNPQAPAILVAAVRTPATGRVGWIVPPNQAKWHPHARTDIFNTLGLT